jgi:translation initiation factor 2D
LLVSPVPGKSAALEVLVQGKQIKAVTDLLIGRGVPKKWIESADLSDKKK